MRSPPTGTWTKITRKHCANTMYGSSFSTLTAAQVFCLQQGPSICSGVYDDRCDSQSSFYACKVGGFDSSSIGSCIYIAATKDEFIRVKFCALCCMLACMCTQLDTRARVLLAIGLRNGVGRGLQQTLSSNYLRLRAFSHAAAKTTPRTTSMKGVFGVI